MVTAHRESERKYDVTPSTPLPDFAALPEVARVDDPVREELDGTYFDLPGLRLAAAGVTLRRRTGGRDAGWHLKIPAEDGARTEFRHPLGRAARAVPEELIRPVRALVRDDQLEPVARIQTKRTVHRLLSVDGTALAEVADDQVTGQALGSTVEVSSWREIEVELVDGAEDLLAAAGQLLEATGAQPAAGPSKLARVLDRRLPALPPARKKPRAGDVVLDAVREHHGRLISADRGVRLGTPDSVHQMRVAARRLRTVLGAFRPVFDRGVTDPIRDELQWLGRVLAGARDTEVLRERLEKLVDAQPPELVLGPVAARIGSTLAAQARDADAEVAAALDSDRYFALLHALETLITEPPLTDEASAPARAVVPRQVRRTWKRVRRLAVAVHEGDGNLHELRKAAKRARYAGETAATVFGKPAKRYAKRMKKLQTVLGEHQDAVVAQDVLRTMGSQAHLAGENGFTFGVLHHAERDRAEAAAAAHRDAYAAAAKKSLRRWM